MVLHRPDTLREECRRQRRSLLRPRADRASERYGASGRHLYPDALGFTLGAPLEGILDGFANPAPAALASSKRTVIVSDTPRTPTRFCTARSASSHWVQLSTLP